MTKFTLNVPASEQASSYQNATLQGDEGGRIAYSIATHVRVPVDVAVKGEEAVRDFLRDALCVQLLPALDNLLESADATGCSDDLTVVSRAAVERLEALRGASAAATFDVVIGPDDEYLK